ncbi:hypothetical protein [Flavobacterium sp. CSZ]|nr:hypothetical protein [Flavobacterium sp. CSZ]MBF4485104.1 hypothetical protein [Flavobacterium sp. CSZ]
MKNRVLIRIAMIFIVITGSYLAYSCYEKSNAVPIYGEIPDANFKLY